MLSLRKFLLLGYRKKPIPINNIGNTIKYHQAKDIVNNLKISFDLKNDLSILWEHFKKLTSIQRIRNGKKFFRE